MHKERVHFLQLDVDFLRIVKIFHHLRNKGAIGQGEELGVLSLQEVH